MKYYHKTSVKLNAYGNWSAKWQTDILATSSEILFSLLTYCFAIFLVRALEIISIGVLSGVANHQSWGRDWERAGCRGTGMVPFEWALVISYRPYIVTFPLSLRVSEILPLLCSSTPLFPAPPLVSSKFPHVPLRIGGWPLGYGERRCWAKCPCNYFPRLPTCGPAPPTFRTDRRHAIRIPRLHSASRGKNALCKIANDNNSIIVLRI